MANYVKEARDKFCYVYSSELDIPFRIKIGTLEGHRENKSIQALLEDPSLQFSGLYQSEFSDLYVVAQIFVHGKPLTLPAQTAYKAFSKRWNWNEWILLSTHYNDVPKTAVLCLTVYDIHSPRKPMVVGGTTISIFGPQGCLRQGILDLRVWQGVEADGGENTRTPAELNAQGAEMARLSQLVKKHREGRIMAVDWLDRLTYREVEVINEEEKRSFNHLYLTIEFPKFHFNGIEHIVVYFEAGGQEKDEFQAGSEFQIVNDPEWKLENLAEAKHHKLSHSLRKGINPKDLKPNTAIRDRIQTILKYPAHPHPLARREVPHLEVPLLPGAGQERTDKVPPVCGLDGGERGGRGGGTAIQLAATGPKRRSLPPEPHVPRRQGQELVQALRYEEPEFLCKMEDPSPLTTALEEPYSDDTKQRVERELADAAQELEEACHRGGDSDTDTEDEEKRRKGAGVLNELEASIYSLNASVSSLEVSVVLAEFSDVASFLIARACRSTKLASYFYWYLSVECERDKDSFTCRKYEKIMCKFVTELRNSPNPKWQKRYNMLYQQLGLVGQIRSIMSDVLGGKEDRIKKTEKLVSKLSSKRKLTSFDQAVRLPLKPSLKVIGLVPEECTLFKSALMPARLCFLTEEKQKYLVMFKYGDDLRQDQLILQLITLMDQLLRRENLDLKLTPYGVLACSAEHGFVELVENTQTVAQILNTHKNIQAYFRHCSTSGSCSMQEIMDTYVKSCAGYSVITYLLSVGDRHFDNLLLSKSGHLIHIDFGYILGRDPKPFAPPMKLSREMVEAMGASTNSSDYIKFKEYCYNAFLILRRSASLILSLFSLMLDAGIPDIALEPDKTLQKVKEKFCLERNEEEAVQYFQGLIDESVTAVFAAVVERFHKLAQYWRK
eukprot:Em0022g290a